MPSDRLLVWLVRAQLLYETIERDLDMEHFFETADSAEPAVQYVEIYEAQLSQFMRDVPPDLQDNG